MLIIDAPQSVGRALNRLAQRQTRLGGRDVPTDNACRGESVKPGEPLSRQWFIARNPDCPAGDPFERQLFVFRKPVHHAIPAAGPSLVVIYICRYKSL